MKLIIAGSRTLNIADEFLENILVEMLTSIDFTKVKEVVSGTANGVDTIGEYVGQSFKKIIKRFPADWEKHGKAAGPIRNKEMAEYADALLLIWDGESKGSKNMKKNMMKLNKPIYELIIRKYNV